MLRFINQQETSLDLSPVKAWMTDKQLQALQFKTSQYLQALDTSDPIEPGTAYSAERTLANSLASLAPFYQGAEGAEELLIIYYSTINDIVRLSSKELGYSKTATSERRIVKSNINLVLEGFRNQAIRRKMEQVLQTALDKIVEQFSDLVAEVHAPEYFVEGATTGVYRLLIIIKEEQYSVVEIILRLADAIFGPLFGETGLLFGLTVMSEKEWREFCLSKEAMVSDTLGRTICLLSAKSSPRWETRDRRESGEEGVVHAPLRSKLCHIEQRGTHIFGLLNAT